MPDIRKVVVNGQEFEVELENDGDNWIAKVEGEEFVIQVPDAAPAAKKRSAGGGKSKKSGKVSANIPGKVVTVEVKIGDVVAEGQVVMILEAMKMQNEIVSGIDGIVAEINVSEGESVEANFLLAKIEPEPHD